MWCGAWGKWGCGASLGQEMVVVNGKHGGVRQMGRNGSETCQDGSETCQGGSETCQGGSETCQNESETCQGGSETCQGGSETCRDGIETCLQPRRSKRDELRAAVRIEVDRQWTPRERRVTSRREPQVCLGPFSTEAPIR